jgi:Skp family chaperone for outer membrane proteins
MKLRAVDFDTLTRGFQPYIDGYLNIESEKKSLIESIQPQKKEIESIIASSSSGLIIDEMTQKINVERFRILQEELMKKDQEFKLKLKEMKDDLNTSVYDQLSEIITEWSKENSIDMVIGKMEVVYCNDECDVTNDIIEILKTKDLYKEDKKEEYQQ